MRGLRVAAVAGMTTMVLLAGARPAGACSVAGPLPPEQDLVDRADLVFEGVAQASQEPTTTGTLISSTDPITWTFTVDKVVKGAASGTQQVRTARSGASCGFTFVVGHRYRVFAQIDGTGGYLTETVSGTRAITADEVATTSTTTSTTQDPPTTVARSPLSRTGFPFVEAAAVALGILVAAGC